MNVSRISPLSFNGTLTLTNRSCDEISINTDDIEEISAFGNFSSSTIVVKDKEYRINQSKRTDNMYCKDAFCAAAHSALLNSYIAAKNFNINVKYPCSEEVEEHPKTIRIKRHNTPEE